ncbi:acyltransferase family protein [Tautonia marina]|uniref:acyltransferase family protein n=1 Tax=Tautonia marina TaxID=2653855 RepID=UPI001260C769|nr:acyltransferase [Tautonia marina]
MSTATAAEMAPPAMSTPANPRVTWIDTFRGLSIVLVVLGHVLGGLAFAAFVPEVGKDRLWAAYDLLYTFRMPALFLASGLFAARSVRKGLPTFVGTKARTLAYPYLLWSLIAWGCHTVVSGMTNTKADPLTPLKMLFDPMQGVWFLYVLFAVMMGFGLWTARGGSRSGFLAIGVALHLLVPLWDGAPSLLVQVGLFAVYFGLGLFLADHVRMLGDWLKPRRLVWFVPLAFGLMKGAVALGWDEHAWFDLVPALFGTLGMFGVAMVLDRLPGVELLRHCGRHSLQLYVASGHASVATRILLSRGLGFTGLPMHIALGTAAGLIAPLVLVAVCKAIGFRYLFTWPAPEGPREEQRASAEARGPIGGHRPRVASVPSP